MSLPPPPPGLDLSETQQPRILAINITFLSLALTTVILRFLSRRISKAMIWWDDLLVGIAMIFSLLLGLISITWMLDHGTGKHVWAGPPDALTVWAKGLFVSEFAYTGTICAVKFSLLAFYWRIFKVTTIRIPIYVIAFVVSCWGIAVILVTIFQCSPVNGFWDKTIAPTCINTDKFFVANSIPNIITDAAILILPMPYIWRLHLPRTQKLLLSSIFVLGSFVVAVSIRRIIILIDLDLSSPDLTWNFPNTQIWTCIETNVAIMCACLPSLRPLLTLILPGSVPTKPGASSGARSGWSRQRSDDYWVKNSKRDTLSNLKSTDTDANPMIATESEFESDPESHGHSPAGPQDIGKRMNNVPLKQLGGIMKRSDINVEFHRQDRDQMV